MSDLSWNLRWSLRDHLAEGLDEQATVRLKKQIGDLTDSVASEIEAQLLENHAENMAATIQNYAERLVEAMLEGDEASMEAAIHATGYTGRERCGEVIRGKLFEYGGEVTRKRLVNAYPELLKSERIKDLEAQVAGLVAQVNKLQAELESTRVRMFGDRE